MEEEKNIVKKMTEAAKIIICVIKPFPVKSCWSRSDVEKLKDCGFNLQCVGEKK